MEMNISDAFILQIGLGIIALVVFLVIVVNFVKRRYPSVKKWVNRYKVTIILSVLTVLFVQLMVAPKLIVTIPPGSAGVVWKRFQGGTQLLPPLGEGSSLKFPWNKVYIYSARYQVLAFDIDAITCEGIAVGLTVEVRFRPKQENIAYLHKHVGENYAQSLILPEIRSWTRMGVSRLTAQQFYTDYRLEVQREILTLINSNTIGGSSYLSTHSKPLKLLSPKMDNKSCENRTSDEEKHVASEVVKTGDADNTASPESKKPQGLQPKYIDFQDVLILGIKLPEKTRQAIVRKVNQKYLLQEYSYRLLVATEEAARKKIEADGIEVFQETVGRTLSADYLRWKGIAATVDLAKSNNSKIVVIGSGGDGLPVILNTEDKR